MQSIPTLQFKTFVMALKSTFITGILSALTGSILISTAMAKEIGQVGVDWLGNDIVIEAIADPKVQGVTCHVAYFDRGLIDRLKNGNW